MRVPRRKSEDLRRSGRSDDNLLTAEAIERLKRTLRRLEEERPAVVEDLTAAREMGDLSENAAYTEAKSRLGRIDNRILSIKERLKNAVLIEAGPDQTGRVQIGATVTVETNGRQRSFRIVGSQETRPGAGLISHQSPLGSALLGRQAGETVAVQLDNRTVEYRIIEVN